MRTELASGQDALFLKNAFNDVDTTLEETIALKKFKSKSGGNPSLGVSPIFAYDIQPTRAVIKEFTGQDVAFSGGLYQFGDIGVQVRSEIFGPDDKTGYAGDRIVWRGNEYRIVGKVQPVVIFGIQFFSSVMRRV